MLISNASYDFVDQKKQIFHVSLRLKPLFCALPVLHLVMAALGGLGPEDIQESLFPRNLVLIGTFRYGFSATSSYYSQAKTAPIKTHIDEKSAVSGLNHVGGS